MARRLLAHIQHARQVHGLAEKPEGPARHGFFEQVIGAVARHEIDFGVGPLLANFQKAVHAVLARHHHVKEAEVKGRGAIGINGLLAAVGNLHLVVVQGQELGQRVRIFGIVVKYKNGKCPRHVRLPPLVFQ